MGRGVSLALRIAASQFPVSGDLARNASYIDAHDHPAAQLGWTYDNRKD
jgi:hypothetical protein